MKKGIVIIFDKNDINISENQRLKSYFNKDFKICLVNNGNHVKLFNFLYKIKENSKCQVSILNLKKEKKFDLALKAGVRFLFNNENFSLILHIKPNNIFNKKLMSKIVKISEDDLVDKINERVMLRKVYALNEIVNC
ncbi:MAG: hypothetical protein ABJH82_06600 [Polaribacter sp.]|uniref:hypothetical protein n=1 Tax=Polaribacter sp. TaxID=1920175 RepID=UPI003263C5F8